MSNTPTSPIPNQDAPKEPQKVFGLNMTTGELISVAVTMAEILKLSSKGEREKVLSIISDILDLIATDGVTKEIGETANFYRSLSVRSMIPMHLYTEYGTGLAKDANTILGVRTNIYQKLKGDILVFLEEVMKRFSPNSSPVDFPHLVNKMTERTNAQRREHGELPKKSTDPSYEEIVHEEEKIRMSSARVPVPALTALAERILGEGPMKSAEAALKEAIEKDLVNSPTYLD